uniref:RNA replicase n=1 Tax=Hubei noda-like virus 23 TaxID=1922979 RepID=A0A1L3KG94_9VIRU|nr:hypothetical protein [Hubei noda-like virus 23]
MQQIIELLGVNQLTRKELTYGVVLIAGCSASAYYIAKISGYGAIAPYPESDNNRVLRAMQRAVIDKTKTSVERNFYPLDSLRTVQPKRSSDNGHAVSGAVRDAARRLINEAIDVVGGQKYEINPNSNSTTGLRNHFHYAVGDLGQDFRNDTPNNAIIIGIDVDYYISEPDVLLKYMNPIILHTFNPIKVSGFDADSPFTIQDNIVNYRVSGGNNWKHPVWDWCESGEFIESKVHQSWKEWIKTLPLRLIGLTKVGYHKIHHCRPWLDCPDRALVYTIPQYTLWRFSWIKSDIHVRQLKRIQYQDINKPGWNRLEYVNENNQLMVSIGRENEHAQATIEKSQLDVLSGLSATQSVNARLIGMGYKDPQFTSLIVQYYTGKKMLPTVSSTIYRPTMPRVHWPITSEVDIPEVSARQYTKPILSDCMMVPMIKRWETMSESIERRVTFVKNDKKPTDYIAKLVDDFVQLLNNGIENLEPLSIEETILRLNKPSQQLQLRAVFEMIGVEPRNLIESFNKNEAGMKSSRIISGFPDILFILKVSRFTLAYSDSVLHAEHNQHWYFPGLNPTQIADKVCEFVSDCDGQVIETDFSNLDGRVSGWMQRNIAQKALLKAFKNEHHKEIISFMDTIINCPAKSKRFGFRYEPGMGVKSGSPTTTPHNTIYNACVEYIALQYVYVDVTPSDIYQLIGPKCGDDGLSRAVIQKSVNRAAKAFGLEIKVERYDPRIGLCFLSRVFIDPLTTNSTIQDPLRTIRKLHLTMRDPTIPLADAACDRVDGYLVTDRLTPLISDYCQMVKRIYEPLASDVNVRLARKSRNKEKPYWLTCDGTWPQHQQDQPTMLQIVINRTGIDEDDINKLRSRMISMIDAWEPITYDSEFSNVTHTIDEDGVAVGTMDESFLHLNDVKQTRANPEHSFTRKKRTGVNSDELQRRTTISASGSGQSDRLCRQGRKADTSSNKRIVGKTNSARVSERRNQYNRRNKSVKEGLPVSRESTRQRRQ